MNDKLIFGMPPRCGKTIRQELAKRDKVKEILEKIHDSEYSYYYNRGYSPSVSSKGVNCSDETYPGATENFRKIQNLLHKKIKLDENAFQEISNVTRELHELMKKDHMGLTKCSEREADIFLDAFVNFNHFKQYEDFNGNKYLSIDPIIGPKYE